MARCCSSAAARLPSLIAASTRSARPSASDGSMALGSISRPTTSPAPVTVARTRPPPALPVTWVLASCSWAAISCCCIWAACAISEDRSAPPRPDASGPSPAGNTVWLALASAAWCGARECPGVVPRAYVVGGLSGPPTGPLARVVLPDDLGPELAGKQVVVGERVVVGVLVVGRRGGLDIRYAGRRRLGGHRGLGGGPPRRCSGRPGGGGRRGGRGLGGRRGRVDDRVDLPVDAEHLDQRLAHIVLVVAASQERVPQAGRAEAEREPPVRDALDLGVLADQGPGQPLEPGHHGEHLRPQPPHGHQVDGSGDGRLDRRRRRLRGS